MEYSHVKDISVEVNGREPGLAIDAGTDARAASVRVVQRNPASTFRRAQPRPGMRYMPQRSAGVHTAASHSARNSSFAAVTVMEQPAISNDVT